MAFVLSIDEGPWGNRVLKDLASAPKILKEVVRLDFRRGSLGGCYSAVEEIRPVLQKPTQSSPGSVRIFFR